MEEFLADQSQSLCAIVSSAVSVKKTFQQQRKTGLNKRQLFMLSMMVVLLCFVYLPQIVEGRGKKKKKKSSSSGGAGPTCATLGLDCSATCCLTDTCAETKLDCATKFKRPFDELYTGFAAIFLITMGVSIVICMINFCLMFKFCQHYDENLDSYVGGFSICDAISCLLTFGLIYRKKKEKTGPSIDDLDFRKRFEKSMDKQSGELGFGEAKKRKPRARKAKDPQNYLSNMAKDRGKQHKHGHSHGKSSQRSLGTEGDESYGDGPRRKRNKCHEFCCIVFCCMDANIYYGDEAYQKMVIKAEQTRNSLEDEEAVSMVGRHETQAKIEPLDQDPGIQGGPQSDYDRGTPAIRDGSQSTQMQKRGQDMRLSSHQPFELPLKQGMKQSQ